MAIVLADATTTIAWLTVVVSVLGWLIYAGFNLRSGRAEIGSEIELAANRKPYYADGEALRDDEKFCNVSAWEWTGEPTGSVLHEEPLLFESAKLSSRSYK